MSYEATDWAASLDIPSVPKLVLMNMGRYADSDGGRCFPGVSQLAKDSSMSERNLQRMLRELETWGLVTAVNEKGGGRGNRTEYKLHLEKGDIDEQRATVAVTVYEGDKRVTAQQRVTTGAERVTTGVIKGDNQGQHIREGVSIEPPIESPIYYASISTLNELIPEDLRSPTEDRKLAEYLERKQIPPDQAEAAANAMKSSVAYAWNVKKQRHTWLYEAANGRTKTYTDLRATYKNWASRAPPAASPSANGAKPDGGFYDGLGESGESLRARQKARGEAFLAEHADT